MSLDTSLLYKSYKTIRQTVKIKITLNITYHIYFKLTTRKQEFGFVEVLNCENE